MLKLRKILLYNYIYYLLLVLVLIFSFLRININNASKLDINNTDLIVSVESFKIDGNYLSMIVKSKEKIKCSYYISSPKEKEYLLNNIRYKTLIKISGSLSNPNNNTIPNTFNYKKYLLHKKIYYLYEIKTLTIENQSKNIFFKIKNNIFNRINTYKSKDYLFTFITGNKDFIEQEDITSFSKNGISHLFAISGMHINLFALILLTILKRIHIKENKRYLIVSLFLLFYCFITSFSASVVRSTIFFILLLLNKIYYTNIKTINICILTISILLIINPNFIYDIGFQYSVMTSTGLILYSQYLNKKYFINILLVSLVAFLFSFPITVVNFYEINILCLLNNIFFVPFVSFIIYPFSLITFIFKMLDPVFLNLVKLLSYISIYLSKYNIIINIPKINLLFFLLYYVLIIYFKKIKYSIIFCITIIILSNIIIKFDNKSYIYFFDVSQGDCSLFMHDKRVIMIDTGGKIDYKLEEWEIKEKKFNISDNIIIFLKSKGIKNIDLLIITHGDEDHAKEALNIISKFKVDNIMFNMGEYNDLEQTILKENINIIKKIDNSYIKTINLKDYYNENDNSIITYININNFKFLLMGDASKRVELDLISKYNLNNIEVLKVGHHGSKTSSSNNFINNINPKYSIISVGKNNKFGHPNKETLDNLNGTIIYRTDLQGTIMYEINKNKYKVNYYSP